VCGTPVVGIRGSYMDRTIPSNQNHWGEQNSPDSLETAISQSAKLDLAAIGEAADQQVAKRYSWRHVFHRMFDIYEPLQT
jgi:alpha-1,6-mannosyltransferase